ncbi:hypothetical protein [Leifsonia sp. NPDC058248]|uniref:phage tail protein n=1 Tax=Leifsonia sp. NPDC058248 TaxID=3346402 RepID=UPI0036D8239C
MSEALSAGTVSLPVKPDTNGFGKKLSDGILGQSDGLKGIGGKIAGTIMAGVAAVGIGVGIAKIFHTGFDEAKDASAGVAQLTAGIKSTGNAANVTVKGMTDLASSIQGVSGQTDDSVVKAEQLLLTFTNIKNSGPDKIFDQATLAASNMAAKMGGDASSQAILLGKALNDPVKGITALTRVGVSFTQGQKDTIAALVKTGDTVGAQKLILGELNKEFGGAAAAAGQSLPGSLARTRRAFEDISQSIVEGFMPIVAPAISGVANALVKAAPSIAVFSSALSGHLAGAVHAVAGAFADFRSGFTKGTDEVGSSQSIFAQWGDVVFFAVQKIGPVFDALKPVFASVWSALSPVLAAVGSAFKQILPAIAPLIPQVFTLASSLSPLRLIFTAIAPVLPQLISSLGSLAASIGGALGGAIEALMPTLTSVVGILTTELAAVFKMLVPVVLKLVEVIGPVLGAVIRAVMPIIQAVLGALSPILQALMPLITGLVSVIAPLVVILAQVLGPVISFVAGLMQAILVPIIQLVAGAITVLVTVISWLVNTIVIPYFKALGAIFIWLYQSIVLPVFNAIGAIFNWLWRSVISPVAGFIGGVLRTIGAVLSALWQVTISPVAAAIGIAFRAIGATFSWIWNSVISPVAAFIGSAVRTIGGVIGIVFGTIGSNIRGAFNGVVDFVRGIFNNIIGIVNNIIDGINGATSLAGAIGIHIGAIPHLPRLADSGTVMPRPGGTAVVVAEAGKAESVVDTGKLNDLMDRAGRSGDSGGRDGDTFNIYEAISARATALQVSRRQAQLGAV